VCGVKEAPILRKHGKGRNTKEQMECLEWIKPIGGGLSWNREVKAKFAEMFPLAENTNHDPGKVQLISKLYKKRDSPSKVA
jgi:hypothetical protein